MRFSYVIPGRLAGMSWPEFARPVADVVAYLASKGITTIVNTTTGSYADAALGEAFEVIEVPMANMTAPTIEQMDRIFQIYALLDEDAGMAVHCMHGLGRTGTVLACILGKANGLDAETAIQRVRQLRRGSIESDEQERFVLQYLGD